MKLKEFVLFTALVLAVGSVATGCVMEREGPAERAGRNIDRSMDDAADAVEDIGDDIEDAADDMNDRY